MEENETRRARLPASIDDVYNRRKAVQNAMLYIQEKCESVGTHGINYDAPHTKGGGTSDPTARAAMSIEHAIEIYYRTLNRYIDAVLDVTEEIEMLEAAGKLTADQGQTLRRRDLHKIPIPQIAEEMGITENSFFRIHKKAWRIYTNWRTEEEKAALLEEQEGKTE